MLIEDILYSNFTSSVDKGDLQNANKALMQSLGVIIVKDRENFVHLLNECDVDADTKMSDRELIDLFIDNVAEDPEMMLGASMLVNCYNKKSNFDGDDALNNEYVKGGYVAISDCFNGETYSNAIDPVTAIAETVGKGIDLGSKGLEGRQKKKYGLQDAAIAKNQARDAMKQQVIAQREQELQVKKQREADQSKNSRTALIVVGAVVGVALLAFFAYKMKKK